MRRLHDQSAFQRQAKTVVALFLSGLVAAGCATSPDEPLDLNDGTLPLAERVTTYGSLAELAQDSTTIVEATFAESATVKRDSLGFWRVPMLVAAVHGGEADEKSTVMVRSEVALPGTDGEQPLLAAPDHTFVLYLTPLEFLDGPEEGVWTVTGYLAGYFERTSDGVVHPLDPEGMSLTFVDEDFRRSADFLPTP